MMLMCLTTPKPVYPRQDGIPKLLRSRRAFVDVLGTSEHAKAETAPATLSALDSALRRAPQSAVTANAWFQASWFSDNLSISAPLPLVGPRRQLVRELSLAFVIIALFWLQWSLATDGFFIRGGVRSATSSSIAT